MSTHAPDNDSALILNRIIAAYNLIRDSGDRMTAITEFACGAPSTVRPCDICFGFCEIEPVFTSVNINTDLVLGQGIYRLGDDIHTNTYSEMGVNNPFMDNNEEVILPNYLGEIPINIKSQIIASLGSTARLRDVYMIATVYFNIADPHHIDSVFVKGSSGGYPLLFCRDISEESLVSIIKDNTLSGVSDLPPNSLELFKVVISIDNFVADNETENRLKTIVIDNRKPRGWGGFFEEKMAVNIMPVLIKYTDSFIIAVTSTTGLSASIANLVLAWKSLSWPGGFDSYWDNETHVLPLDLYNYINEVA